MMLKATCLLICSLICIDHAFAQLDTAWTRQIDYNNYLILNDAALRPDGNFAVCGYSLRPGAAAMDVALIELSENGEILSQEAWGGTNWQTGHRIAVTGNGTQMVFGMDESHANGSSIMVMGFNADGDSLWTHYLNESNTAGSYFDAVGLPNGNVALLTYIWNEERDSINTKLMFFDETGDLTGSRIFDFNQFDMPAALTCDSRGSIYLVGQSSDSSSMTDVDFVVKTDSNGEIFWTSFFDADNERSLKSITAASDGSLYLAGYEISDTWRMQPVCMKLNFGGDLIWTAREFDEMEQGSFYGIAEHANGGIYLMGNCEFNSRTNPLTVVVDENGEEIHRWINDTGRGWFNGISSGEDGLYLACGTIEARPDMPQGLLMLISPINRIHGTVTDVVTNTPVPGVIVELLESGVHTVTDENGFYRLFTVADSSAFRLSGPCIVPAITQSFVFEDDEINTIDFTVGVPEYQSTPSSLNILARADIPDTAYITITNNGSGELEFAVETIKYSPDYDWLDVFPMTGIVEAGGSAFLEVVVHSSSQQGDDPELIGVVRVHNHSCPDSVVDIHVLTTVLDTDVPVTTPYTFGLNNVYPNPFNGEASIQFSLEHYSGTTLTVYDLTGREVATLADDFFTAGSHTVHFSLPSAASGLYLIRLQAGSQTDIRKVALIK